MINQLLPTISYGDAVSNSAINMMKVLRNMGYQSKIYAQNIDPRLKQYAEPYSKCPKNEPVIYHLSTGSELSLQLLNFTDKKIILYHNITPSNFFRGYNGTIQSLCEDGRHQLQMLSQYTDYALADSEYNRRELISNNYKNTQVTPIIINFEDYQKTPSQEVVNKYKNDGYKNLLFVGRMAPNKKQEDIIKSFYYYKKYINPKSRLFLIGSSSGMERYHQEITELVNYLELDDVYIMGHVSFNEILAYYKIADLFISMSEHEGFCVPLLEAMQFKIPILAYKSSAVGETLANGGFLVDEKNYKYIAELINIILTNENLKNIMINNQKARLDYFSKEKTTMIFQNQIKEVLG